MRAPRKRQVFGLDAGVNIMAHGLWNWGEEAAPATRLAPAVQATLDRVLQMNVGWQPTFRSAWASRSPSAFVSFGAIAPARPTASLLQWYGTEEGQSFHNQLATGFLAASKGDAKAMEAQVNELYSANFGKLERATRYWRVWRPTSFRDGHSVRTALYSNPPALMAGGKFRVWPPRALLPRRFLERRPWLTHRHSGSTGNWDS